MEWKKIEGYTGYYVNRLGDIMSMKRRTKEGKILKLMKNSKGYLMVCLSENGVSRNHLVHRLVANAFIEKIEGKPFINHKNDNRCDNRVVNLEWCTASYNVRYHDAHIKSHKKLKRKIAAFKDGRCFEIYEGLIDAAQAVVNMGLARKVSTARTDIGRLANWWPEKTRYGFSWRYISEPIVKNRKFKSLKEKFHGNKKDHDHLNERSIN